MTESPNFLRRRFHRHRWVGPRWHVAPGSVIPIYEYWQTCERCGLHREQINRMGPFISDRDRWVEW